MAATNLVVPMYHLHVSVDVVYTAGDVGSLSTEAYTLNFLVCDEPCKCLATSLAVIGITMGTGPHGHKSVSDVTVYSTGRLVAVELP